MNYYSPHTGELIETATPSDWMGLTDLVPPIFDSATQGCFFRSGAWVIVDAEIPPPASTVPQIVSRFKGCAALMQAGYLDDVEAYMAGADPFEQLAWKTITEMRRNSPMTEKIGQLLGLDERMIDDLFRFAATISA